MPRKNFDLNTLQIQDLFASALNKAAQNPGIDAYQPHASQEKFHRSTAKEKLYIGGNRSGKTLGSVCEAVFRSTGKHPFRTDLPIPSRGRVVAVDIEDGIKKIVLPEFMRWTPPSFLKNGSFEDSYDKQSRTLTLTNGSFIEFMSYEQEVEKFAGTSRHWIYFDEEPPEDIFNECLMRLVDTDGDYWIAMTPLIEMSWTVDRIYEPWLKGDDSIFVLTVNTEENPHIKMEALDRITRGLSDSEKSARREGAFLTRTGLIYAPHFKMVSYKEGGNLVPDIVPNLAAYTKHMGFFACMDHGWANPSVFIFCAYNDEGTVIAFDEIYEQKMLVRELAQVYLERREALGITTTYCVGDPSIQNKNAVTGTSVQSEYQEHGVGIGLGNNNVGAGIVRMQNMIASRRLFISERCEHTLKELREYRWDKFASSKMNQRRNLKDTPLKKNDHCMDALRYGIMSRPALEGEEEFKLGNPLNLPSVGPIDIDYEKCFATPDEGREDDILGIEW